MSILVDAFVHYSMMSGCWFQIGSEKGRLGHVQFFESVKIQICITRKFAQKYHDFGEK